MTLIYKFKELDNSKVKEVGGKNASLGEMFQQLGSKGIKVPDGFATSAAAYWKFIRENDIEEPLSETLGTLDENAGNLRDVGAECRRLVMESSIPEDVKEAII